MDFAAALAGLQQRGPGRMVPDLERITRLADLLGEPQSTWPNIHVTGTNGKTSTTRMIAALLAELGLAAGTYTSPHLQTVRERIQVALHPISRPDFARTFEAVAAVAGLVDEELGADDRVTYFELLTAMGLWYFADLPVDVGVIEVGMGGRWDATNVLPAGVAVVTPIDVDHRELGDDAQSAAREKAGIIKQGGRAVFGRQSQEVLDILEAAADEAGVPVARWDRDHELVGRAVAVGGQQLVARIGDRRIGDLFLPLHGRHQADNAVLALAGVAAFLGERFDHVDDLAIREGMARVTSPGRLEVISRDPTIVLDGAHNPHGARAAAAAFAEAFTFRNVVMVIASMADKDVGGIVAAWSDVVDHVVVTRAPSPRSASSEQMAAIARDVFDGSNVAVEQAPDVATALDLATGLAARGDGVLITGSLFTVGAVRDILLPVDDSLAVGRNERSAGDERIGVSGE